MKQKNNSRFATVNVIYQKMCARAGARLDIKNISPVGVVLMVMASCLMTYVLVRLFGNVGYLLGPFIAFYAARPATPGGPWLWEKLIMKDDLTLYCLQCGRPIIHTDDESWICIDCGGRNRLK